MCVERGFNGFCDFSSATDFVLVVGRYGGGGRVFKASARVLSVVLAISVASMYLSRGARVGAGCFAISPKTGAATATLLRAVGCALSGALFALIFSFCDGSANLPDSKS